jgi:hypothetical protein
VISHVYFHATNASGGGTILQPDMYELPEQIGAYPAGTILMAGKVFSFVLSWIHVLIIIQ